MSRKKKSVEKKRKEEEELNFGRLIYIEKEDCLLIKERLRTHPLGTVTD